MRRIADASQGLGALARALWRDGGRFFGAMGLGTGVAVLIDPSGVAARIVVSLAAGLALYVLVRVFHVGEPRRRTR